MHNIKYISEVVTGMIYIAIWLAKTMGFYPKGRPFPALFFSLPSMAQELKGWQSQPIGSDFDRFQGLTPSRSMMSQDAGSLGRP